MESAKPKAPRKAKRKAPKKPAPPTTRDRVEARLKALIPEMSPSDLINFLSTLDRREEKRTGDTQPIHFSITTAPPKSKRTKVVTVKLKK